MIPRYKQWRRPKHWYRLLQADHLALNINQTAHVRPARHETGSLSFSPSSVGNDIIGPAQSSHEKKRLWPSFAFKMVLAILEQVLTVHCIPSSG